LISISHLPALFSPPPTDSATAGAGESFPGHYSASRWHPRVAPLLFPLLLPRAGVPRPCHAPRSFQSRLDGRHRDAAVGSPGQSPPPSPHARPSNKGTQKPIPLTLLLFPRAHASERRRRT